MAFWADGWIRSTSVHAKMGLSGVILGALTAVGGVVTSIIKFKIPMQWNTSLKLKLAYGHRIFGYLIIIFTQAVIFSGLYNFFAYEDKKNVAYILGTLSCALLLLLLIVGEIVYQITLRKEQVFKRSQIKMTPAEFEQRIADG